MNMLRIEIKILLLLLLLSVSGAGVEGAGQSSTEDLEKEVRGFMDRYSAAFQSLSVSATLPFFHAPISSIGPDGSFAINPGENAPEVLAERFAQLREDNYKNSVWGEMRVEILSDQAAVVTAVFRRYRQDDSLLLESGGTYVLAKENGQWSIVLMTGHDVVGQEGQKQLTH